MTGSPLRGVATQIEAGVKGGILSVSDQTVLMNAYTLCWPLQAAARLLSEPALDIGQLGIGGRDFVLRETAMPDEGALASWLDGVSDEAATVVTKLLGPAPIT